MPLQPWMKLLSTDDHLIEPPHVWSDRLPAALRDRGPVIVEQARAGGGPPSEVWRYEDRLYPTIGLNAVAGKRPEEFGIDPTRYDEMIPGCYDPRARLADMDIDGVWGALCFPSFPRFAGTVFLEGEDRELAHLCVLAWNDYILDEWCATAPDRFIPLIILPLWDVELCVAEIHRCAAKGAKAIAFPENPVPLGLPSFHTDHWDPVLSAAEETGMPLSMHFGTSGQAPITAPEAPMAVMIALFGCNSMYATADLLFSPVFHKHPRLKVGLSEGGIGWMPYLLERIDTTWERHRFYQNVNQDVRPSELFAEHFHGCFIDDSFGIQARHAIGIDNITWECDYPHSDSYWPKSRAVAAERLADVPDGEVHKIVELNTRRLYDFGA
ncbi:amidohydrolase family protein [Actinomadura chokoriensis]|uniref:Amidohydrolase family protein n=1 Tax=Actinomadura chokoriensis TaxID=454156 RepID=A0ABV4QSA3_9ACTN